MPDSLTWGAALRLAAEAAGYLTYKELADATGAAVSSVNRWYTWDDYRPLRLGHVQGLVEALGLQSPDDLKRLPDIVASSNPGPAAQSKPAVVAVINERALPLSVIVTAMRLKGASNETVDAFLEDAIEDAAARRAGRRTRRSGRNDSSPRPASSDHRTRDS